MRNKRIRPLTRDHYIYGMQKDFFTYVYSNREHKINKRIHEIAAQNQILVGGNTASFVYKDKWYPQTTQIVIGNDRTRQLHLSFHPEMEKLVGENNFDLIIQQTAIKNYFTNVLTTAGHIDDVTRLFPEPIKHYTDLLAPAIFNITDPLSSEKIEELKQQFKSGVKYIHQIYLIKLLSSES